MKSINKIDLKEKVSYDEMDLSLCDLHHVPVNEIAHFTRVQSLDLSNNQLQSLPNNFAPVLTNLTKLDLSKNRLKELPDNFGDLYRLKQLDLYDNNLQHLPISFAKLKALRWLDLKNNPLVPAIQKVVGDCADDKQCQQCAKTVIAFYTTLNEKIEEEREIRQKYQERLSTSEKKQVKLETKETNKQTKKKEKREKQKALMKNVEGIEPTVQEPEVLSNVGDIIVKDQSVNNEENEFNLILLLLTFIFITSLVLFISTSVDYTHTRHIKNMTLEYYQYLRGNLPVAWLDYIDYGGSFIEKVHNKIGRIFLKLWKI